METFRDRRGRVGGPSDRVRGFSLAEEIRCCRADRPITDAATNLATRPHRFAIADPITVAVTVTFTNGGQIISNAAAFTKADRIEHKSAGPTNQSCLAGLDRRVRSQLHR